MAPCSSWACSLLIIPFISLKLSSAASAPYCKPLPNGTNWPSNADWNGLNKTVSGRLIKVVPPGVVCHGKNPAPGQPTCANLAVLWNDSTYHANDAASVDYNDETCYPNSKAPCSADGYPAYVIMAANSADVQAGLNFASKKGVRLIVKASGHDFPGRSSGAGSLSINTRNIRGMTYNLADTRAVALGGIGSVKISAGERFGDIYKFAYSNGFTLVGSADTGVGIGGWVLGGGHGPISAVYGLGADQVIEMEVVTADGKYRTINANTDSDLFWAMRGGGGSTFAVLVSVTMKVFQPGTLSLYSFSYNTTANSDAFYALNAYFHSQLPSLANKGVKGYYFVYPQEPSTKNQSVAGQVYGIWTGFTQTSAQIALAVADLEKNIASMNFGAPVIISRSLVDYPNYSQVFAQRPPGAVGQSARVASRLLDTKALGNTQKLKQNFKNAMPAPWFTLGHLLAKPGVWSPPGGIAGGSNAVLPAWRTDIAHVVLPRIWTPLDQAGKTAQINALHNTVEPNLHDLAPDTGEYSNESDPTESDWQTAFYGSNYQKLLSIKNKYDPNGVFWCKGCVGSEQWTVTGWNGQASEGVGQDLIKLCRTK